VCKAAVLSLQYGHYSTSWWRCRRPGDGDIAQDW